MVESFNKLVKKNYLRKRIIKDFSELNIVIDDAVHDYSFLRPHCKHFYQTPFEAFTFKKFNKDIFEKNIKNAQKERVKYNQINTCNNCNEMMMVWK